MTCHCREESCDDALHSCKDASVQGVIAGQCSGNDVITATMTLKMTPYNDASL